MSIVPSRKAGPLALLLFLLLGGAAVAHTPSETFLTVVVPAGTGSITGHWDVAERDLIVGIGLDAERAAKLDPAELDRRLQALALDVEIGRAHV